MQLRPSGTVALYIKGYVLLRFFSLVKYKELLNIHKKHFLVPGYKVLSPQKCNNPHIQNSKI